MTEVRGSLGFPRAFATVSLPGAIFFGVTLDSDPPWQLMLSTAKRADPIAVKLFRFPKRKTVVKRKG
jgi:hypothetical protein